MLCDKKHIDCKHSQWFQPLGRNVCNNLCPHNSFPVVETTGYIKIGMNDLLFQLCVKTSFLFTLF